LQPYLLTRKKKKDEKSQPRLSVQTDTAPVQSQINRNLDNYY